MRCDYLVGCDGGTSAVRTLPRHRLDGQASVQQRFMTHFRSDARRTCCSRGAIAWHYQGAEGHADRPERSRYLDIADALAGRRPAARRSIRRAVAHLCGSRFRLRDPGCQQLDVASAGGTIVSARPRVSGRRRRASIHSDRRLRHEHGIGDACDLGWKLAAVLHGFASPDLLASYDDRTPSGRPAQLRGRRPATPRCAAQSRKRLRQDLTAPGAAGDDRARRGRQADRRSWQCGE